VVALTFDARADADALGRIIQAVHARGHNFVTLDALLG